MSSPSRIGPSWPALALGTRVDLRQTPSQRPDGLSTVNREWPAPVLRGEVLYRACATAGHAADAEGADGHAPAEGGSAPPPLNNRQPVTGLHASVRRSGRPPANSGRSSVAARTPRGSGRHESPVCLNECRGLSHQRRCVPVIVRTAGTDRPRPDPGLAKQRAVSRPWSFRGSRLSGGLS